jgi:DNA-binding PadR family transcriptional regulator
MTNAELAILGLIAEKPRHGYEIEQLIKQRGMRNWTEVGFSSVYYILNKLEQRGWVRSRREAAAGRGPARKVFSIQPEGKSAWRKATLDSLSSPQPSSPFLLGLAGLDGLRPQDAVNALRQYRQAILKRREEIQNAWESSGQAPLFLEGMFEFNFNMLQTELDWLDRYIPRLESLVP